jgi:hypothetical protein
VRRAAGAAGVAVLLVVAATLVRAATTTRAPGTRSVLDAWAFAHPAQAGLLALVLALGVGGAVFTLTWLPWRRRFIVDRANFYVVWGRRLERHPLSAVNLSADPPTLHVGDRQYPIDAADHGRLAGLLRVAVPLRSRHARPMAASNPTVLEERQRRPKKIRRHPTML